MKIKTTLLIIFALSYSVEKSTGQSLITSPENRVVAISGCSSVIPEDGNHTNGWTPTNAYWASPLIYRSKRFPDDGTGSIPFNQYGELMIQGTSSGAQYNRGISFFNMGWK